MLMMLARGRLMLMLLGLMRPADADHAQAKAG